MFTCMFTEVGLLPLNAKLTLFEVLGILKHQLMFMKTKLGSLKKTEDLPPIRNVTLQIGGCWCNFTIPCIQEALTCIS